MATGELSDMTSVKIAVDCKVWYNRVLTTLVPFLFCCKAEHVPAEPSEPSESSESSESSDSPVTFVNPKTPEGAREFWRWEYQPTSDKGERVKSNWPSYAYEILKVPERAKVRLTGYKSGALVSWEEECYQLDTGEDKTYARLKWQWQKPSESGIDRHRQVWAELLNDGVTVMAFTVPNWGEGYPQALLPDRVVLP